MKPRGVIFYEEERGSGCHEQCHLDGNSHATVMTEDDGLSVVSIYVQVPLKYPVLEPGQW